MVIEAQAVEKQKPFGAAQTRFFDVVDALGSEALGQMSHGEAEEHVLTAGREVMRLLLQGYFDLRGLDDAAVVVGADGVIRTRKRRLTVHLQNVVGGIDVARTMHGMRGCEGVGPLDAALNMPVGQHSLGAQRRVAEEGASGSYDEATAALIRHTGVPICLRKRSRVF